MVPCEKVEHFIVVLHSFFQTFSNFLFSFLIFLNWNVNVGQNLQFLFVECSPGISLIFI